jgi:restriction system protein
VPIPTYDVLMLSVLWLSAEKIWVMKDLVQRVADDLHLDEAEREEKIPSGIITVITSRVHWAKTYLKQAGLIEQPKRAYVQVSEHGREVLKANPSKRTAAFCQ